MKPIKTLIARAAVAAAAGCWCAATAHAGDVVKIAGRASDKVASMSVIFGVPGPGHFAYHATGKGIIRAPGDPVFDGLERTVHANWDISNGAGRGNGYATLSKGGDSVITEWTGTCSTLLDKDGRPSTACAGGWLVILGTGTGRFAGLAGGGSWTGSVLPDGSFEGEFEGQYSR